MKRPPIHFAGEPDRFSRTRALFHQAPVHPQSHDDSEDDMDLQAVGIFGGLFVLLMTLSYGFGFAADEILAKWRRRKMHRETAEVIREHRAVQQVGRRNA